MSLSPSARDAYHPGCVLSRLPGSPGRENYSANNFRSLDGLQGSVFDQLYGQFDSNAKPQPRRPAAQGGHKRHGNQTRKRKGPSCTKFGFCRVSQGQNTTKYRKILCNSGPTPPEAAETQTPPDRRTRPRSPATGQTTANATRPEHAPTQTPPDQSTPPATSARHTPPGIEGHS